MTRAKSFKILLTLFFLSSLLKADVFNVRINARVERIPAFREARTLYISLPDLLSLLQVEFSSDSVSGFFYFKIGGKVFKLSAENPFIVVSSGESVVVYQLPVDVISGSGKIFVPVKYFSNIFSKFFTGEFNYDEKSNMINISIPEAKPSEVRPLSAYDISDIEIEKRKNGYLVKLVTTGKLKDYEVWLGQNNWLYITIANASVDIPKLKDINAPGIVSKVEVIPYKTAVQISLKLVPRIEYYEVIVDKQTGNILISLYSKGDVEDVKRKFLLDVVVIDPGHGGKDPGAIGVYGTQEKDVTLGIARKLKKLVEGLGVKVVMTREEDEFVELYRRGQIANENGGKLFISIHCNSMPYKPHPANGFETYLLRPGKTEEAIRIAERENAVIRLEENYEERYKHLTDESYILTAMAYSVYVKKSERFAEILTTEARKNLSTKVNGVSQAGFYVLVGASMPSVLIETAYLSNPNDEKYLRSESGQWEIARTIFNAVKKFKEEYEAEIIN